MRARDRVWTAVCGILALTLAGCASIWRSETPPGPGVPRIANLRFDPEAISVGESTQMSFYFEVGSADMEEGFLIERGISQFQFYHTLQAIPIDLRKYDGQVAGTVEIPLRWSSEGIRLMELYVVNKKGNASNRLRAPLTVR